MSKTFDHLHRSTVSLVGLPSVCHVLKRSLTEHTSAPNIPVSSNLSSLFPSSHSRCVNGLCVPKGQSYSCKCSEGYQGQYCDRRQEPPGCRGQRCGHGECRVSEAGEPVCHCQPGYTGPTCDTGKMEKIRRGDGNQEKIISRYDKYQYE